MAASQPGPRYTGWWLVPLSAASGAGLPDTARYYVNGTIVATASSASFAVTGASTSTTTVTGGTGVIATTGDIDVTAGNFRAGVKSAFATTEPTSALIMKAGTAPAGAITTSSGIFSSATVVQKIVAGGTVNNVET